MNNFIILYQYEWKKLLDKKIVWITFALCIVIIIVSLSVPFIGSYYIGGEWIDTKLHMYQTDKRYSESLSGRAINQKLLEETIEAYRKIPYTKELKYSLTEEYQQYARQYSAIFNFIVGTTNMQSSDVILSWQPNEHDLYEKRQQWLNSIWEEFGLSEGEIDFWQERELQIKTPVIYEHQEAYNTLLSCYQTIGLFVLLLISICLSGIFSEEHTRKTDQIILCSSLGKTFVYWVKITTGISFAVVSTLLLSLFTFILTICLHGADGFYAIFQLIYPSNSDPISCGQAILIAYGTMIITAIVTSIFVMVLSELLHSNIATLAISTGLLIMAMFVVVPEQYRLLAQLWDWLPWCFLAPWNVFGKYTISIFGHYFTSWQAVPMIYLMISIVIAVVGKPIYQRFQVSGR